MAGVIDFNVEEGCRDSNIDEVVNLVNFLEEDKEFQEEIDDIQSDISTDELRCQVCFRSYKTLSTLEKHCKSHVDSYYTNQIVFSLITKAKDMIISAEVHSAEIIKETATYSPDNQSVHNLTEYLNSIKMKGTEPVYNRLYQDIMRNSSKYFTNVTWKTAAVLSTKFAETVITSKHHHDVPVEITTKNMNEKEIAGMQYLGGYVIRKVYHKIRTSKSSEKNEQAMALILNLRVEELTDTYTDDLSRGGLWKISDEMSRVLAITEKYFCIKTAPKGMRSIPLETFVDALIQFPPLKLTFNDIASSSEIEMEETVVIDTLSQIIRLYLRVRSFSLTKDIVAKMRQKQTSKNSLRKTIKLASKLEDTKKY